MEWIREAYSFEKRALDRLRRNQNNWLGSLDRGYRGMKSSVCVMNSG
jgi:hypothetical protein